MQARRKELLSQSFALAHGQFVQCLQPVDQLHKDAVRVFFEEGRTVFGKSNPASLAVLMDKPDSPASLHKLFRYCVQKNMYIGMWHDTNVSDSPQQPMTITHTPLHCYTRMQSACWG